MPDFPIHEALATGSLPNPDAVLQVRRSVTADGPGRGMRALEVRPAGGIDLRLLPDRGLDIGAAWFGGYPLAWTSAVGEAAPLPTPRGFDWADRFGGGLVTTCGLRNVGLPSEGHGLHGTFSHLPAADVVVRRHADDDLAEIEVTATIDDVGALSHHLRLRRSIRSRAGSGRVRIRDVTVNLGRAPEPAPLLYHVNLGFPLWEPGSKLRIATEESLARDVDSEASLHSWDRAPAVTAGPERVLEHVVPADDAGFAHATVINERLGLAVDVAWRSAELPRLHQWIHPAPGIYVLGLEPANCSTLGREADRAEGRLPMLAPGQRRETAVEIRARHLAEGVSGSG